MLRSTNEKCYVSIMITNMMDNILQGYKKGGTIDAERMNSQSCSWPLLLPLIIRSSECRSCWPKRAAESRKVAELLLALPVSSCWLGERRTPLSVQLNASWSSSPRQILPRPTCESSLQTDTAWSERTSWSPPLCKLSSCSLKKIKTDFTGKRH